MALEQGRIVAAEALLRWQHPHRGLLEPAEFIHVAESSGLIVQIGDWLIREACRQAVAWREHAPVQEPIRVSVNLSARQIARADIASSIANSLRATGLEPGLLELELTESVMFEDLELTTDAVQQLKALGVRLVLDDFGTGYSSLGYLKRLPIDALKIDRTFVGGLGREGEDSAIVNAVLSMASALGVTVTAEGVETHTQLARLRTLGCAFAQGHLFAEPAPATMFSALLGAAEPQPSTA
jgi:EAL domain-containing protein (putative c-di-GMP-specific phosphodiesterase class I)